MGVMEHHMGDEKIEQNVERLKIFLFNSLGCGKDDTRRILSLLIKNHLDGKLNISEEAERGEDKE